MRARGSVTFILVTLLLDTLGVGVIIPVLPRLIEEFVGGDLARGSSYYGIFVAVYAAMQFVCAPIMGGLSDRYGRRVVILASLLAAALDYLLLAFAPSLGWLFVGRVISGAAGASFSPATAYIADVTPPEKRAQSFGLVGAAFGVGFILGPALGGFVGNANLRAPFMVAAGLNFLNLVYGIFVLPESLRPELRRPFSWARANPLGALRALSRSRTLIGLSAMIFCTVLAQQMLQAIWALYTQARFEWRPFDIGLSLSVVGVSFGLVQAVLVRLATRTIGERRAVLLGLVFNVASFVGFAFATHGWMMYALLVPFSVGGLVGPCAQAILSREVGASEQGELQGSLVGLQSVTAIFGPILATRLFAMFAPAESTLHVPGAPFLAAACLHVLGLAIAARLFARLAAPRPA